MGRSPLNFEPTTLQGTDGCPYPTKRVLAGKSSIQKCRLVGDVLVSG